MLSVGPDARSREANATQVYVEVEYVADEHAGLLADDLPCLPRYGDDLDSGAPLALTTLDLVGQSHVAN